MVRYSLAVFAVLVGISLPCPSVAQEPGWVGQVVKPRSQRSEIRQTPIVDRPYRPLHFYGNTVRRMYYHGRLAPNVGELENGLRAFAQDLSENGLGG